ncbi:RCC1 domain-containing protein 1-like [Neodiprion fabricii]|uniref:RCC1 domain-containing protein 1-like n=1 Tax=Neodiprion fabricii TaxID=2872261 RepID=UPI001ED90061|nr:RCC1 domain-containing protein 1-like [Neodiprion fabricii]XP_046418743.1 RCC1 domain-containing protein 1-like [Neodiprion fabricii]XP_046418744.1 RCC1 domain-containing protein 1-like [Neodiprion fabricii]
MKIYYTGLNNSELFCDEEGSVKQVIDKFTIVPFTGIEDLEIGWNYILLWRDKELFISGKINLNESTEVTDKIPVLLKLPEEMEGCVQAIPGKETITILSVKHEIWQYKVFDKMWKQVSNFIQAADDNSDQEYTVKIFQGGCTVALTNFGRVYNIPILVDMPKRVKFTDVACGFDHTIILAENGEVYSMGMGSRGQLGHGDLEDCDNPTIIEALAGLKVVQISAAGWHSAVVTDQGDLYTWGWNTEGQMGISDEGTKVYATPKPVDFMDTDGRAFDASVKKAQCGNAFTICMMDDNSMWGCGSNKYGQLGMSRDALTNSRTFLKLNTAIDEKEIKNFKCREWGAIIITD